ncbi:MAG: radical SAM protein [Candidatus Thermoplasmatota archaeon]|nr:radical SAM protein [Candidatus Thermoplasmatota archaeon]
MINVQELVIYPLSTCNLRCKHCYVPDGKKYVLTKKNISWIHDMFNEKKTIIMGGEPLLYEHLEYILKTFKNVTISTNGVLIKKNLNLLKKHKDNVTIQLSIEAGEKETNGIRGYETDIDVWNTVMESASLLEENNVSFYFRCSYHSDNLKQIKKYVFPLSEQFNAGVMFLPRIDKIPLDVNSNLTFFRDVLHQENCAVAQPHFFQFIGKHGRCKAGDERINIFYDKRITPCNLDLDYTLGRIGDEETVIRNNIKTFLDNFKVSPFECSSCKHSSECKGSCYISKSYLSCPLKHNFNIENLIQHENLNKQRTIQETNILTDYVKHLGIC